MIALVRTTSESDALMVELEEEEDEDLLLLIGGSKKGKQKSQNLVSLT